MQKVNFEKIKYRIADTKNRIMNDTLFIAIIAACSALLGSLIPTIISYLNNRKQNDFELNKALLERQKEIYWELMLSLQNMINSPGSIEFKELQKSVVKVSIYGDNISSIALSKYYYELVNTSQQLRVPLTREEHRDYQKEIINGMRENLGLLPFDNFEIVAFRPEER